MSQVDVQRLRELEVKATKGEWSIYDSNSWRRIGLAGTYKEILWPCTARSDGHPDLSGINRDADLTLIAAMRNALPDLLDEVERLREALKQISTMDGNILSAEVGHRAVEIARAALGASK